MCGQGNTTESEFDNDAESEDEHEQFDMTATDCVFCFGNETGVLLHGLFSEDQTQLETATKFRYLLSVFCVID